MRDLTPAETLAATAADMQAVADALGDAKRPWYVNDLYLYPQSIRATGVPYLIADAFDQPPHHSTAEYIAAWDPTVTDAVASWLEDKAAKYGALTPDEQLRACATEDGVPPPMLKVCAAWWKSRGIEPPVPA